MSHCDAWYRSGENALTVCPVYLTTQWTLIMQEGKGAKKVLFCCTFPKITSTCPPQDMGLICNGRLCNFINVLDKAIKCNEKNIYIVNANTIITICCEQEQNMNNLNADMSQWLYQDLFWSLPSMDINVLLKLVRDKISSQYGFQCDSSGCQTWIMFYHIPCSDKVSPQYGS